MKVPQKPFVVIAALAVAAYMVVSTVTAASQSVMVGNQQALIQTLGENSDALREQVQDAGVTPVAPTTEYTKAEAGDDGKDGRNGPRGFTGPPVSEQEISASVNDYCALRLDCVGETGAASIVPGGKGDTGADSQVPGKDGKDGGDGAPGADSTVPGPLGVGIAAIECQPDGVWLFTLTDQSTRQVTGPCRVDPITPPKETP